MFSIWLIEVIVMFVIEVWKLYFYFIRSNRMEKIFM